MSHISNQIIDMSNLGEAFMMRGLVAREMSSKRSMCFMNSTTFLLVILFPSACR